MSPSPKPRPRSQSAASVHLIEVIVVTSQQKAHDNRGHEICQGSGQHRAQAQARQVSRRVGARAPMPPIWIPIEEKLAKPHNAYVAIVKDRGSRVSLIVPSCEKAMNSFNTMRVPRRLPIVAASRHGTPKLHATAANTQPKIC